MFVSELFLIKEVFDRFDFCLILRKWRKYSINRFWWIFDHFTGANTSVLNIHDFALTIFTRILQHSRKDQKGHKIFTLDISSNFVVFVCSCRLSFENGMIFGHFLAIDCFCFDYWQIYNSIFALIFRYQAELEKDQKWTHLWLLT